MDEINDLKNLEIRRHRRVWRPFMEKYDCKRIAEIGVFEGENFYRMIEHGPELAVAVDMWKRTGNVAQADSGYDQERLDAMHDRFADSVKDKPFVRIVRKDSVMAASGFPDGYFDLVYIDGDHTYEGCKRDIEAWYPKVRPGGYVTGDDYWMNKAKNTGIVFQVKKAVLEFAGKDKQVHELPWHGWAIIKPL